MRRYLVFLLGLVALSLGISLTAVAALGTSPISSPAYVVSEGMKQVSFGTTTFIWNAAMVLFQLPFLKKKGDWLILLVQIPVALLLGVFVDGFAFVAAPLRSDFYIAKLGVLLLGCMVSGAGVALMILSERVLSGAERLTALLAEKYHKKFGTVKVLFDAANVLLAVILCLFFFHDISRVREGTLINALVTGTIAQFFLGVFRPLTDRFLQKPGVR